MGRQLIKELLTFFSCWRLASHISSIDSIFLHLFFFNLILCTSHIRLDSGEKIITV
ncbi:hypothetical protein LINGRAHAP2_LOCUS19831 [Linum grandiflorum]